MGLYQRALGILEAHRPGSLDVALTINNIGNLFKAKGQLAAALDCHEKALAMKQALAPGSLQVR